MTLSKVAAGRVGSAAGYISLATTIVGAAWLSMAGENLVIWLLYLAASITGVANNVHVKNKKMVAIFAVYLVTNFVAITRLLLT